MGTPIAVSAMATTVQNLRGAGYRLGHSATPVLAAAELNHLCHGGTSLLRDSQDPQCWVEMSGADLMTFEPMASAGSSSATGLAGPHSELKVALQNLAANNIQFVSTMVGGNPISQAMAELQLTVKHHPIALQTSSGRGQASYLTPGPEGFHISNLDFTVQSLGSEQEPIPNQKAFDSVALTADQVLAVSRSIGPMLSAVSAYRLDGDPPVRLSQG